MSKPTNHNPKQENKQLESRLEFLGKKCIDQSKELDKLRRIIRENSDVKVENIQIEKELDEMARKYKEQSEELDEALKIIAINDNDVAKSDEFRKLEKRLKAITAKLESVERENGVLKGRLENFEEKNDEELGLSTLSRADKQTINVEDTENKTEEKNGLLKVEPSAVKQGKERIHRYKRAVLKVTDRIALKRIVEEVVKSGLNTYSYNEFERDDYIDRIASELYDRTHFKTIFKPVEGFWGNLFGKEEKKILVPLKFRSKKDGFNYLNNINKNLIELITPDSTSKEKEAHKSFGHNKDAAKEAAYGAILTVMGEYEDFEKGEGFLDGARNAVREMGKSPQANNVKPIKFEQYVKNFLGLGKTESQINITESESENEIHR